MKPIALYVHVPFCTVKCGYCDFNAYAGMHHLAEAYADALLSDLVSWQDVTEGRTLTSIAFGGGTPSEVPAAHIARVIERATGMAEPAYDIEISLEANPGTLAAGYMRALRDSGVNRLSIGAQSFDARELAFLDRVHSPEATVAAVGAAREAGFDNLNLDLIYGLPGHNTDGWRTTLERALALQPEHLSTYALTVEEGTPLAARVGSGAVTLPDEDQLAELYEVATATIEAAGLRQYEISNWAMPGYDSRHNSTYWHFREYVGIGAGAHGLVAGRRYENIARPAAYIAAFAPGAGERPGVAHSYEPAGADAMADWLSLRLRLLAGFASEEFAEAFGVELAVVAGDVLARVRAAGVLEMDEPVRLSRAGRLLHGEVVVQFYTALQATLARV